MDEQAARQDAERRVHIFDHPESRIAFLETALGENRSWSATIHASAVQGAKHLLPIKRTLDRNGYSTGLGTDEHGEEVLTVLHLGSESGLLENIHALGLTEGMRRSIDHCSLQRMTETLKSAAHYFTDDKAHLISAFYILGDIFLMFSGTGNQSSAGGHAKGLAGKLRELKKPENALQSLAGVATAINSIILMIYAQGGDSKEYRQMKEQFYKTLIHGKNAADPEQWEPPPTPHSAVEKLNATLHEHPLGGAVAAQLSAMIMTAVSGGLRWHHAENNRGNPAFTEEVLKGEKRNGKLSILRSILSSAGWLAFLYPAHTVKEKAAWYTPKGAIQAFQENPERVAAPLTAASSIIAIAAGKETRNFPQMAGEAALLLGDATIFFTDTKEYSQSPGTTEATAKMAARFIGDAPMLMNKEQLADFVQRISRYLAGKRAAGNPAYDPATETPKLADAISEELKHLPNRTQEAMEVLTELVSRLPRCTRGQAITALADALVEMPGVYLSQEEIVKNVNTRLTLFPKEAEPATDIRQLAPVIAGLIPRLPMLAVGRNLLCVYDTLTQFVPASARDFTYLNHAMKQEIQQGGGVSSHQLAQIEQQIQAQRSRLH